MFSSEYCENFKNTYFEKHLRTAASEFWKSSTHKNSTYFTKVDNRVLIWSFSNLHFETINYFKVADLKEWDRGVVSYGKSKSYILYTKLQYLLILRYILNLQLYTNFLNSRGAIFFCEFLVSLNIVAIIILKLIFLGLLSLTLFRMGVAKRPPASFFLVTSTNVRINP